jgi:glycosyltransferase involved in cell wall biosynthesis
VTVYSQDNWLASAVLNEVVMCSREASLTGEVDVLKTSVREPESAVYTLALCSDAILPRANGQVTLVNPAEVERYVREIGEAREELNEERTASQAENARLDAIIRDREGALAVMNDRVRHQDEEIIDLTMRLNAIYGSPGYRILGGYRKVTRTLFPPDSKRGIPYRMMMRGVRGVLRLGRRGAELAGRGSRARARYGTAGVIKRGVERARSTKAVDPIRFALQARWTGEPAVDKPREREADAPIVINWVVPTISEGGGLRTISRFYEHLQRQGFRQRVYEMPVGRPRRANAEDIRREAKRLFNLELDQVSSSFEQMEDADVIFATSWHTAYPVLTHKGAGRRFYFVQDFEPQFAAVSTESVLAENTYRFGFHGITAGPWLSQKLSNDYGMTCDSFDLAVDPLMYYPKQTERENKVFYYARPATPRRGYELGMQALELFHARHPEFEIVLAGGEIPHGDWKFRPANRGHISEVQLNDLYNQCRAALVISLTNCSLLPLEIMAAGCPVVTTAGPNNSLLLPKENVLFAVPSPQALADELEKAIAITNRDQLVQAARRYRWEDQFRGVEQIIREAVGQPAHA